MAGRKAVARSVRVVLGESRVRVLRRAVLEGQDVGPLDDAYVTRRHDRATNLWPLALLSFGESWHNGHHADPACARHGTGPRQLDISAAVIGVFERLGWATAVHWPDPVRLAAPAAAPPAPTSPEIASLHFLPPRGGSDDCGHGQAS